MSTTVRFIFLLAAVIVWVLAALGNSFKAGSKAIGLVPLGLALAFFPALWDLGEAL